MLNWFNKVYAQEEVRAIAAEASKGATEVNFFLTFVLILSLFLIFIYMAWNLFKFLFIVSESENAQKHLTVGFAVFIGIAALWAGSSYFAELFGINWVFF